MPRKLKVFQAQFGFYDTVVAAASQAAALRAWGAHQNLFSDGGAKVTTDEQAIEVALAHPEVPLRRAIGSDDPYSLNPRLPRLPDLPDVAPQRRAPRSKKAAAKPRPAAARPEPPKPIPPDRSGLDAAEAALGAIEADRKREMQAYDERRAALEEEARVSTIRYTKARSEAEGMLKREQQAFIRSSRRSKQDR